jgi:hypothetical protein
VYRDRATGRVVSQQEFAEIRAKGKPRDDKPKMVDVHLEWKGGLAQRREAEERAARMAAEVGDLGGVCRGGGGGARGGPHSIVDDMLCGCCDRVSVLLHDAVVKRAAGDILLGSNLR